MSVKAGQHTCRILGFGIATALVALLGSAGARASQDRSISFYHIHTKETLSVQYKRGGRFDADAMKKINWIMRDWRRDQATTMDPATIDIIWEMHRELGSQQPVHIISGYRSPATNEMLRKTRGGQATKSQHMTGKAIDISFPDVPVRRMRYSAMIRERGGVGYYPTSGIPFVHVDTGRVRHWPRMVHDELALLFPSGRSKHQSASGRSITPSDVKSARERRKDLVQEMNQYFALRDGPKAPIQVAAATPPPAPRASPPAPPKAPPVIAAPLPVPPAPTLAQRPEMPAPHKRMAVGAPMPAPEAIKPEAKPAVVALASERTPIAPPPAITAPAPKLVSAPRAVDRPSAFVTKLPDADRSRLDMLVQLASLEEPAPQPTPPASALITGATPPAPVAKPPQMTASMTPGWPFANKPKPVTDDTAPVVAEVKEDEPAQELASHGLGLGSSDWRSGWLTAPEYDDDHPEELAYRPFALAPLLTETPSFDDPALQTLVHPDAREALAMLDDEGAALPMRLGSGHLQTAMAWAQEFKGSAVDLAALGTARPAPAAVAQDDTSAGHQLMARAVKTQPR